MRDNSTWMMMKRYPRHDQHAHEKTAIPTISPAVGCPKASLGPATCILIAWSLLSSMSRQTRTSDGEEKNGAESSPKTDTKSLLISLSFFFKQPKVSDRRVVTTTPALVHTTSYELQ